MPTITINETTLTTLGKLQAQRRAATPEEIVEHLVRQATNIWPQAPDGKAADASQRSLPLGKASEDAASPPKLSHMKPGRATLADVPTENLKWNKLLRLVLTDIGRRRQRSSFHRSKADPA